MRRNIKTAQALRAWAVRGQKTYLSEGEILPSYYIKYRRETQWVKEQIQRDGLKAAGAGR